MKTRLLKYAVAVVLSLFCFVLSASAAYTQSTAKPEDVIAMLESIDTLQEIQNNRSKYTTGSHYDINTTNSTIIKNHNTARSNYENYVVDMISQRVAAHMAYNALSDEEKNLIDPSLVAKLSNDLPTVLQTGEFSVTPRNDEYTFEAVEVGVGFGYEVSNHMVSGSIPQTFVLVDTSDNTTTWSPSGEYAYGESNYIVAYCCDKETGLVHKTDYKRINLEDSDYFDEDEAKHIRAILENAYPYITIEEMKSRLIADGLDSTFVNSLTRADIIAAIQLTVWNYANVNDAPEGGFSYFATIDIPKNTGIYFNPLHDYTNEIWDWLPGKKQRTFDTRAQYRVNTLADYLSNSEGVEATPEQVAISKIEVLNTKLAEHGDGSYDLTVLVSVNGAILENDDVDIIVKSYNKSEDGTVNTTSAHSIKAIAGQETYKTVINTKDGDTVHIEVNGVQDLPKGVYFYQPEGGREASQSLVAVSEGLTSVYAEGEFTFTPDIEITPIEPDSPDAELPVAKRNHYIVFGKTEKIGWYSVSLDGGESFQAVFGNSNLEVAEGTEMIIKANYILGDPFTFYINGKAVSPDENGYITVTVDGFMLIGALGIPEVNVPDAEESLNFFQKIVRFFRNIIEWIKNLF